MQSIYEKLRTYEERPNDATLKDLRLLIDEQHLLIQHEHPVQKRKIQAELSNIRDKYTVIMTKQNSKSAQENELKNREALFQGSDHTHIQMEQLQMEYAHTQVDSMINQGKQYIGELSSQNQTMRKMKNKILTSLSTLGVSQSLIAKINTRLSSDLWLFWILIVLFFLTVYLFYRYVV
eukprot:NODE_4_length_55019_cov_0.425091.p32 type:complete len:178 gc:universal NODE_4_length_55019_cov_0.425091:42287-41754(-)